MTTAVPDFIKKPWFMGALVLLGLFFNALLAFANAHVMRISTVHVMAMEALILGGITCTVVSCWDKTMRPWLLFGYFYVIVFLYLLMLNAFLGQSVSPKALRDMLLISAFGMLGIAFYKKQGNIIVLLKYICILVLIGLFIENYFTVIYGQIFDVLGYYVNTRDAVDRTAAGLEGLNLFNNTELIEGRFSLGFLTTHRLSSLFLEQTTLGNFSAVLAMSTSIFWSKLSFKEKLLFISTIIATLIGTDSRLGLGTAIIILLVHNIAKILPPKLNITIIPIFLFTCCILFYDPIANYLISDDIQGRFTWSVSQLSWIDTLGALGGRPELIGESMDSGYSYLIYSQTIMGLIVFWLFTSRILPQKELSTRRGSYYLSIFICLNLMVGPTLLSIKTAALLWFIIGYSYRESREINLKIIQNHV